MYKAFIAIGIILVASVASAETTRYVSDVLEIPMRAGKTTQYRIIRMLKSGTKLTVMEEDASGYSRVSTNGAEGWVLTRFLMEQASARSRVESAEEKAIALEIQNNGLREEVTKLNARLKDLQQDVQRLTADNNRLNDTLTQLQIATADEQRILEESTTLKEDLRTHTQQLAALRTENERLQDRKYQQYFLYGAGVLFLGLVMGWLMPHLKTKKRSNWDGF